MSEVSAYECVLGRGLKPNLSSGGSLNTGKYSNRIT